MITLHITKPISKNLKEFFTVRVPYFSHTAMAIAHIYEKFCFIS